MDPISASPVSSPQPTPSEKRRIQSETTSQYLPRVPQCASPLKPRRISFGQEKKAPVIVAQKVEDVRASLSFGSKGIVSSDQTSPLKRKLPSSETVVDATPPKRQRISQEEKAQSESPLRTPQKEYPLYKSPTSERIKVLLTSGIRRTVSRIQMAGFSAIYRFSGEDVEDTELKRKAYTGASGQVMGRISSHLFKANNPDAPETRLSKSIRANPKSFVFRLLEIVRDPDTVDDREKARIEEVGDRGEMFNVKKGGAGPRPVGKRSVLTRKQVLQEIKAVYKAPKHEKIFSKLSPYSMRISSKRSEESGVIYDFFLNSKDAKKRVHHIGYSTEKLKDRMFAHLSAMNNPDSAAFRGNPKLYTWLRENAASIRFQTFDTTALKEKGITEPELEKGFGDFFQGRGEQVRNMAGLGRGGVSKKKRRSSADTKDV